MVNYLKINVLFLFPILILWGCSSKQNEQRQNKKDIEFPNVISLESDSAAIEPILKPGNIYLAGPYIVLSDMASNKSQHFAVFNTDLKFLYTFGDVGLGSEEILMPTVVKNMPSGKFLLRDQSTDDFILYELSDSCAYLVNRFKIGSDDSICLWEINYVSDNNFLAKKTTPRQNIRKLINFKTGVPVDSLPPTFDLANTMGKNYYSEFDDFWFCVENDKFACSYYFIDRIEFGKIDKNGLSIIKNVGVDTPPDFYIYTDEIKKGKYEYNVDYNTVYYEWAFSTGNMLYASYFGEPWGEIDKHSSIIEVYSMDGVPQNLYKLNNSISSFIVIGSRNLIVGINPEKSDELFYLYSIRD